MVKVLVDKPFWGGESVSGGVWRWVVALGVGERTGSGQLAVIGAAHDALFDEPARLLTGQEQLDRLQESLRLGARFHTWQAQLAALIDADEIASQEHGTSTATWLADAANLTRREAGRLIGAGLGLARFPIVAEAARSGEVLSGQAEAITAVLDDLPEDFPMETVRKAQGLMVGFAATHNSAGLRRLGSHLVEVLDPETVVGRRADRPAQPGPAVPTPPRHPRTRPRPHHRPLENPAPHQRSRRNPPATTRRPQPTTPPPRPLRYPTRMRLHRATLGTYSWQWRTPTPVWEARERGRS
jgi:hypothetical protein